MSATKAIQVCIYVHIQSLHLQYKRVSTTLAAMTYTVTHAKKKTATKGKLKTL